MKPEISVILPVHNTEPYIAKCLESILSQNFRDFEIIAIDDHGKDRAMDVVKSYAALDERIRIVDNGVNRGVSYTRNEGIRLARGKYIALIDSDDAIDPGYFEALIVTAKAEGADVIKADFAIDYGDKEERTPMQQMIRDAIAKGEFVGTAYAYGLWCCIFEKDLIVRNQIEFPPLSHGEDNVFLLEMLLKARKFALCDEACYRYTFRQDSTSKQISPRYYDSVISHYQMLANLMAESDLSQENKIEFWHRGILGPLLYHHLPLTTATEENVAVFEKIFTKTKELMNSGTGFLEAYEKYPDPFYQKVYTSNPSVLAQEYVAYMTNSRATDDQPARVNPASGAPAFLRGFDRRKKKLYLAGVRVGTVQHKGATARVRIFGVPVLKITKKQK